MHIYMTQLSWFGSPISLYIVCLFVFYLLDVLDLPMLVFVFLSMVNPENRCWTSIIICWWLLCLCLSPSSILTDIQHLSDWEEAYLAPGKKEHQLKRENMIMLTNESFANLSLPNIGLYLQLIRSGRRILGWAILSLELDFSDILTWEVVVVCGGVSRVDKVDNG